MLLANPIICALRRDLLAFKEDVAHASSSRFSCFHNLRRDSTLPEWFVHAILNGSFTLS